MQTMKETIEAFIRLAYQKWRTKAEEQNSSQELRRTISDALSFEDRDIGDTEELTERISDKIAELYRRPARDLKDYVSAVGYQLQRHDPHFQDIEAISEVIAMAVLSELDVHFALQLKNADILKTIQHILSRLEKARNEIEESSSHSIHEPVFSKTIEALEDTCTSLGKALSILIEDMDLRKNMHERVRENNQLKREIEDIRKWIPRQVIENGARNASEPESLMEACRNASSDIIILDAYAGYGKTHAVKQLYQSILDDEEDSLPPPIYMSLDAGYQINGIFDTIERTFGTADNNRSLFLLLDGYDQLSKEEQVGLLKDIYTLTHENQSASKKVLIAVRSREYEYAELAEISRNRSLKAQLSKDKATVLNLLPLTGSDVSALIHMYNLDDHREYLEGKISGTFRSDNIFFVSKYLEYYRDNREIPHGFRELMEYLVKQEAMRFNDMDRDEMERNALYMTLMRKQEMDMEGMDFPALNHLQMLSFSHKTVQEYLSACRLKRRLNEDIIAMTTNDGIIRPHMKNTVGMLLQILSAEDNRRFKSLFNTYSRDSLNIDTLICMEPTNLSYPVIDSLIDLYIEQHLNSPYDDLPHEEEFNNLFYSYNAEEHGTMFKDRLTEMISSSTRRDALCDIACTLGRNEESYRSIFGSTLWNMTLNLLEKAIAGGQSTTRLLLTLAYLPLETINSEICRTLLSTVGDCNSNFQTVAFLLARAAYRIDEVEYDRMFDAFLIYRKQEHISALNDIPEYLDDDTELRSQTMFLFESFIRLTGQALSDGTLSIGHMLQLLKSNLSTVFTEDYHAERIERQLAETMATSLAESLPLSDGDELILTSIIAATLEEHYQSTLLAAMMDAMPYQAMLEIYHVLLSQTSNMDYIHLLGEYASRKVREDSNRFKAFRDLFSREPYYEDISTFFYADSDILPYLPCRVQETIRSQSENLERSENRSFRKSYMRKSSFHTYFDEAWMMTTARAILDHYGSDVIDNRKLRSFMDPDAPIFNYCMKDMIASLPSAERSIEGIRDEIHLIYQHRELLAVGYIQRNYLSPELFTPEERSCIEAWIQRNIHEYRLPKYNSPINRFHECLAYLMRFDTFRNIIKETLAEDIDSYIGLLALDGPSHGNPSYMEDYLGKQRLLNAYCANFKETMESKDAIKPSHMLDYLNANITSISFQDRELLADIIRKMLKENARTDYWWKLMDLGHKLDVTLEDIPMESLTSILKDYYRNKDYTSIGQWCLSKCNIDITEEERRHTAKALHPLFLASTAEKEDMAISLLLLDRSQGDVASWYFSILMQRNSRISSAQYWSSSKESIYTSDPSALHAAVKLYSFAWTSRGPKASALMNVAVNTFKAMAAASKTAYRNVVRALESREDQCNDSYLQLKIEEIKLQHLQADSPQWKLEEL